MREGRTAVNTFAKGFSGTVHGSQRSAVRRDTPAVGLVDTPKDRDVIASTCASEEEIFELCERRVTAHLLIEDAA